MTGDFWFEITTHNKHDEVDIIKKGVLLYEK